MSTNHARRQRVGPDTFTRNSALLHWKNQPQSDPTVAADPTYPAETHSSAEPVEETADGSMGSAPTGDPGEDILRLLRKGESVEQVSILLNTSKTLVKRWQRQLTHPAVEKMDGRRLYNDAFKLDAIQQIKQGVSVRQLSLKLGVSQVTLHKWKNKELQDRTHDQPLTLPPAGSQSIDPLITDAPEPMPGSDPNLRKELQSLREERDILKKALVILLRSS
ncbi:transposase [Spirosoma jeollabukense]